MSMGRYLRAGKWNGDTLLHNLANRAFLFSWQSTLESQGKTPEIPRQSFM